MKTKYFAGLCGMLLLCAIAGGAAQAERLYAVNVPFFGGLDFETGAVRTDPTVLIVTFGPDDQLEHILTPAGVKLADFQLYPDVDLHVADLFGAPPMLTFDAPFQAATVDAAFDFSSLDRLAWQEMNIGDALAITPDTLFVLKTTAGTFTMNVSLNGMFNTLVTVTKPEPPTTPEPGTLALFGVGLLGGIGLLRRKPKSHAVLVTMVFAITLLSGLGVVNFAGNHIAQAQENGQPVTAIPIKTFEVDSSTPRVEANNPFYYNGHLAQGGTLIDPLGKVHIAYGDDKEIRYAVYDPTTGVWTDMLVDTTTKAQQAPRLTRNAQGIYLASNSWENAAQYVDVGDSALYFLSNVPGSSWVKLTDIYTNRAWEMYGPTFVTEGIFADPVGDIHILLTKAGWWTYGNARREQIYHVATGILGPEIAISERTSGNPDANRNQPFREFVQLDANQTLIIPMCDNDQQALFFNRSAAPYGNWVSQPDNALVVPGCGWFQPLPAFQDADGNVHALFINANTGEMSYSYNWTPPVALPTELRALSADLVVRQGKVYVLFSQYDRANKIVSGNLYLMVKEASGAWQPPIQLTHETQYIYSVWGDGNVYIDFDQFGFAHPFGYREEPTHLYVSYAAFDGAWDGNVYRNSHIHVLELTNEATHTLTVNKTGTGSGSVVSTPAGINCGATCTAAYLPGTSVTLTATPGRGSTFESWTGCDSMSGNQCTVTMTTDKTVTTTFSNQSSVTCSGPTNGLVACYPFDGNANDGSGNGNDGTVNGATLTTDRFGKPNSAYEFNGNGDFVLVPNNLTLNPATLTISAWVKISSNAVSTHMDIVSKDGEGFERQYLLTKSDIGKFRAHIGKDDGSFHYYDGQTSILRENWYHVVQTYDGNLLKLYVNGQYESPTIANVVAGGTTTSPQPIRIGGGAPDGYFPCWFNGTIDDVRIYNRALTDAEIKQLYGLGNAVTLTVTKTGNGQITSTPAGISCGTDCTEDYAPNTQVMLTATADSGFTFTSWSGACTGTIATTTVTMDAAKTCTATFTQAPPTVRTLILTNRQQFVTLYDDSQASQVISKLNALAASSDAQGLVVDLNSDPAVAAAYAARGADYENKDNANAVADAIRQVILAQWTAHPELEYIVITGDDRVVPFYRTIDGTNPWPYTPDPWTLTDDFYTDKTPSPCSECGACVNPALFIPDLASGRLVESPSQIIGQIDTFLAGNTINLRQGVVTGYTFMTDLAQAQCNLLGTDNVTSDCTLSGDAWTRSEFVNRVLQTAHDLTAINGHANEYGFGTADGGFVSATDFVNAPADFAQSLFYTPGCHSGHNVVNDLDLPEGFAIKKANYVGNTGYGWGDLYGIGYSEYLMWQLTRQLLIGTETSIGKALLQAKQRYYADTSCPDAYHEKVTTESTLYGLPMYRVSSSAAISIPVTPITVTTQSIMLIAGLQKETRTYSWPQLTPEDGFYALNGRVTSANGKPVLPELVDALTSIAAPVHGIVFTGGTFFVSNSTPPLQQLRTTNDTPAPAGAGFNAVGPYPAQLVGYSVLDLQSGRVQTLIATAGQSLPEGGQRIFTAMQFDVYAHASSADFTAPVITFVGSTHPTPSQEGISTITVEAHDPSGIAAVVLAYTDGAEAWRSVTLTNSGAAWSGSFPAGAQTEYFVQVVDQAGNVAIADNAGKYFKPGVNDGLFTLKKAAGNTGTGTVYIGEKACGPDCAELRVPASANVALVLKAVPAADSRFVRWEKADGTPVSGNYRAQPGDVVIAVFEKKE